MAETVPMNELRRMVSIIIALLKYEDTRDERRIRGLIFCSDRRRVRGVQLSPSAKAGLH